MKEDKIIIYQTEDGQTQIDVRLENETVWLTQAQMANLFEKDQSVIARHIANVFKEGELEKESNMQILHNTLSKYKPTAIYNLDVIISVGYRVHSKRGTAFRIWARNIIKDYLVKGYAVNQRIHRNEKKLELSIINSTPAFFLWVSQLLWLSLDQPQSAAIHTSKYCRF
jgi:hypothetical protein